MAVAIVCAIGAAGIAAASGDDGTAGSTAAQRPPSVLLIVADDQARNTFKPRFMPRTFHELVDHATSFSNAIAAPPLCCPDRAGILTGQYPHNHGVYSNHPGYAALRDPANALPVWLDNAGYRTGLFGRFMAYYSDVAGAAPAPGFDRWFALLDEQSQYYDFHVSDNGALRWYDHRSSAYSTDLLTQKARRFIRRSSTGSRPFFAWLGYHAPHVENITSGPCEGRNPLPPDRAAYLPFSGAPLPRSRAFNEGRVDDKPDEGRGLPRLRGLDIAAIELRWRCTLAATAEIDRQVGRLMEELRRDGGLRRTIVIYVSDNGFFFGQHRLQAGKGFVYEPALNVPFAIRVPPPYRSTAAPPSVDNVVSNQDLAPTLLEYINDHGGSAESCASPTDCRRMDGRPLQPLLGGPGEWQPGRGVLAEIDTRRTVNGKDAQCDCAYHAIRTRRYVYSEIEGGERELYDLRLDPEELRSRAGSAAYADAEQHLASRLASLRQCAGIEGRDPPGSLPYCE